MIGPKDTFDQQHASDLSHAVFAPIEYRAGQITPDFEEEYMERDEGVHDDRDLFNPLQSEHPAADSNALKAIS